MRSSLTAPRIGLSAPAASPETADAASIQGSPRPSAGTSNDGPPASTKHSTKVIRRGTRCATYPKASEPRNAAPPKVPVTNPSACAPPSRSSAYSGSSVVERAASNRFVDEHERDDQPEERVARAEPETLGEVTPVPVRRRWLFFASLPHIKIRARQRVGRLGRADEQSGQQCRRAERQRRARQRRQRPEHRDEDAADRRPDQDRQPGGCLEVPDRPLQRHPGRGREPGQQHPARRLPRHVEQSAREHQGQQRPERQADRPREHGHREQGHRADDVRPDARPDEADPLDQGAAERTAEDDRHRRHERRDPDVGRGTTAGEHHEGDADRRDDVADPRGDLHREQRTEPPAGAQTRGHRYACWSTTTCSEPSPSTCSAPTARHFSASCHISSPSCASSDTVRRITRSELLPAATHSRP